MSKKYTFRVATLPQGCLLVILFGHVWTIQFRIFKTKDNASIQILPKVAKGISVYIKKGSDLIPHGQYFPKLEDTLIIDYKNKSFDITTSPGKISKNYE